MLGLDKSDLQALPTEPRLAFGVVFAAGDEHARVHVGKTVLILHLPDFCSAINALGAVNGSLSGKEVLLLSDPSSARSQAMASLSRTQDFSSVAQDLWREVPAGSTFIVSGGSIEIAPDALPFSHGARFCVSSLANVMSFEPSSIGDILAAASQPRDAAW